MKIEELRLSDREVELVRLYAEERGLSVDDAASELFRDSMAQKFRRNLGKAPAKVYELRRSK